MGRCGKIKESTEDIICYKILEKTKKGFITPYRRVPVDVESKIMRAEGEIREYTEFDERVKKVSKGVIHTFKNLDDAYGELKFLMSISTSEFKVYECIIPRGTLYYIGAYWKYPSYGSICIKFMSEI
jgi:hypothetical protein